MRIFLLPLTNRQALIYCHRITAKPTGKLSIAARIQKKATETWSEWESAEKGWKKKLVTYGNYGLQRIPYQEWGLKSFPPSTPDLQAEQVTNGEKFDIVYPGNVMNKDDVPKVMARLAKERKTLHYNRFVGSLVAIPFTAPFAIIPVIPNIPFFYAAYRCWSHWRALKGSDHLDFILDHRLFKLNSTPEIETIYEQMAPSMLQSYEFVTRSQVEEGSDPTEKLILTEDSHNLVAKALDVPPLANEIERAVWQVRQAFMKRDEQQATQTQKAEVFHQQQNTQEELHDKSEKR